MTLSKYGKKECRLATLLYLPLVLLCLAGGTWVTKAGFAFATMFTIAWVGVLFFFRDPERKTPANEKYILSPADGIVRNVELISASDYEHLAPIFEGKDMLKISFFVSLLDVRINRSPSEFTVKLRERKELEDLAGESVILAGVASICGKEIPLAIKQISSMGTGKIVCEPVPGDKLSSGQQYGILKFGSIVELYLPAKRDLQEIKVEIGDRVQAGKTAIIEIADK